MPPYEIVLDIKTMTDEELAKYLEKENAFLATTDVDSLPDGGAEIRARVQMARKELSQRRQMRSLSLSMAAMALGDEQLEHEYAIEEDDLEGAVGGDVVLHLTRLDAGSSSAPETEMDAIPLAASAARFNFNLPGQVVNNSPQSSPPPSPTNSGSTPSSTLSTLTPRSLSSALEGQVSNTYLFPPYLRELSGDPSPSDDDE